MNKNNVDVKVFHAGPLATNCYVVNDQQRNALLIDPAAYDQKIKDHIGSSRLSVKCIINTHGHIDHIAGDRAWDLPVMIHRDDAPLLKDPGKNLSRMFQIDPGQIRVERLLTQGDVIRAGELRFEVIHTPGHTPGGICLYGHGLLFSGDTLFHEGIGRTDLEGGDHDSLQRSIQQKLMCLPGEVSVFPGHGPVTTIAHEKRNNPFLEKATGI